MCSVTTKDKITTRKLVQTDNPEKFRSPYLSCSLSEQPHKTFNHKCIPSAGKSPSIFLFIATGVRWQLWRGGGVRGTESYYSSKLTLIYVGRGEGGRLCNHHSQCLVSEVKKIMSLSDMCPSSSSSTRPSLH